MFRKSKGLDVFNKSIMTIIPLLIKTDSLVQTYAGFICDKASVAGVVLRDISNLCIAPPPTPPTSSIVLWPDYRPHSHCSQGYKTTIFMW